MSDCLLIFEEAIEKIRHNYPHYNFFVERDFVWIVQKYISEIIKRKNLPYLIYNDYPIEAGENRSISADLIIINKAIMNYKDVLLGNAKAEFVAEFKFEPSKCRPDICQHKLPVVFWKDGVVKDIERIKRFVGEHKAKMGVAVFVDEYSRYNSKKYDIDNQSKWISWGTYDSDKFDVSVLWTLVNE